MTSLKKTNFSSGAVLAALWSMTSFVNGFESIVRPRFKIMEAHMAMGGQGLDWANHEVHTDDGYILNMFRILPEGVKSGTRGFKAEGEPVLLMHGMGNRGDQWLNYDLEADKTSLPIMLVKEGYDVWIGNQRGTWVSNEHETLDWVSDEGKYWEFSFPEMGRYDLPAMISTISEET
jgi:pimeloyl-ACP methyl ester carboxylesterase